MARALPVLLLLVLGACSSESDDGAATVTAKWEINADENLAVPVCGKCGEVIDRTKPACTTCQTVHRIEAKTIPCPECAESKKCVHCGAGAQCLACDGSHACVLCEGDGKLGDEACPDCAASGACAECKATECERCGNTGDCVNCDAKGTITLQ